MSNTSIDNNSLAHTKWNCKYHIVFAPKYRLRFLQKSRLDAPDSGMHSRPLRYTMKNTASAKQARTPSKGVLACLVLNRLISVQPLPRAFAQVRDRCGCGF